MRLISRIAEKSGIFALYKNNSCKFFKP